LKFNPRGSAGAGGPVMIQALKLLRASAFFFASFPFCINSAQDGLVTQL
jgi:hypothetical protein